MIRISEHQLHHLIARLSERAMTVLRFLSQQRFATTSHLARLLRPHHTSPASALRQTSRLTKIVCRWKDTSIRECVDTQHQFSNH